MISLKENSNVQGVRLFVVNTNRTVASSLLVVLCLLLSQSASLAQPESSEVLRVPSDFSSIQAAINAANSGQVIVVSAGIYLENIDFKGKNITVRSSDPQDTSVVDSTIIDGSRKRISTARFINGESSSAVLEGFTITGGSGIPADDLSYYKYGGGVSIFASSPTIRNNHFLKNNTDQNIPEEDLLGGKTPGYIGYGGAMFLGYGSQSLIENNRFTENVAYIGGAIYAIRSQPTIQNNQFTGNAVRRRGGAIAASFESEPTIHENVFTENVACLGGAIFIGSHSDALVQNNTIKNNRTWCVGGGISVGEGAKPRILNNLIEENYAPQGGGILTHKSSGEISGNQILDNEAGPYGGGGIGITESNSVVLDNNSISGNVTQQNGGGLFLFESSAVIINNSIENNESREELGGGIGVFGPSLQSIRIEANNIYNNSAHRGGGLAVLHSPRVQVFRNRIIENTSQTRGGGIFLGGHVDLFLQGNEIVRNKADNAGIIWAQGGVSLYNEEQQPLKIPDSHNHYQGNSPSTICIAGTCYSSDSPSDALGSTVQAPRERDPTGYEPIKVCGKQTEMDLKPVFKADFTNGTPPALSNLNWDLESEDDQTFLRMQGQQHAHIADLDTNLQVIELRVQVLPATGGEFWHGLNMHFGVIPGQQSGFLFRTAFGFTELMQVSNEGFDQLWSKQFPYSSPAWRTYQLAFEDDSRIAICLDGEMMTQIEVEEGIIGDSVNLVTSPGSDVMLDYIKTWTE